MLLAVDMGNTQTTFGVFSEGELAAHWQLATDQGRTADEYVMFIDYALASKGIDRRQLKATIIATASPHLLTSLQDCLKHLISAPPLLVGPGIKTKIRIRFDTPADLSGDRIANSLAAHSLFAPGPHVVVDFGTATVFDVISREGEYLGGVLSPGVRIAAEALAAKTARIPRVELVAPQHVIGRTTAQALQSGLFYGHADLLTGILKRIKEQIGSAQVIATGAEAQFFAELTGQLDRVEPHLTLMGLRLLHDLNSQD